MLERRRDAQGPRSAAAGHEGQLNDAIDKLDWPEGVGPKLKQMLRRGVGVHHAGMLPKYRRMVEELFNQKLLAVCVCTETLAAGINLPARSVVLTSLVKGPCGKEKLIDASTAHQIFGRAGRPQFDDKGFVFALAHEDDVRLLRWKEKYDQIPEDTRDPGLLKAKKALKKKKPVRSETIVYWTEGQFKQLQGAPPGKLYSKGPLPWRLLAYLLKMSPEVSRVRTVLRKRLMDEPRIRASEKQARSHAADAGRPRFRHARPVRRPAEEKPAEGAPPPPPDAPTRRTIARSRDGDAGPGHVAGLPQHPSALRRRSCSSISASPTATSASRRWRACWRCRAAAALSSACRFPDNCRPVRWRRPGSTRN